MDIIMEEYNFYKNKQKKNRIYCQYILFFSFLFSWIVNLKESIRLVGKQIFMVNSEFSCVFTYFY